MFKEESLRWPIFTIEQLGVAAGNLALSFSLNFFSIFVHISGSNKPITVSWHHWKDLLLLRKLSIDNANFGQKW